MKKNWHIKEFDDALVQTLASGLSCHPIIAGVLVNRGVTAETEARMFLEASPKDLRSPFSLTDMDAAVKRIYTALVNDEKILVFGDYDADGVTATALLVEFLEQSGAKVVWYIPHRILEGYSLKAAHITGHAAPNHVNLIITVDCGSGSFEAVAAARSAGIDVIVTDHHIPPESLPEAVAVVNPNRPDCRAGLGMLAGVGVAFYLLIALRSYLRDRDYWLKRGEPNLKALCDLVAIGTVADMAPLVRENRILTQMGLSVINHRPRPGIGALMGHPGLTAGQTNAEDIAFRMAPRLNAAGRLDHAKIALALLIGKDPEKATAAARSLIALNAQRQQIEVSMFDEITKNLQQQPQSLQRHGMVLFSRNWHEGVLGIVASRLTRRYCRPVALISLKHGTGKGSVRSVPGVDIVRVLSACASDLDTFGGHAMAAGIAIAPENVSRFQAHFNKAVASVAGPDRLTPSIEIDCRLDFGTVTDGLIDQLEMLQPFGAGNAEPLFMTQDVTVSDAGIVGHTHRRMRLTQDSGGNRVSFNAIQFNVSAETTLPLTFDRIAYRLRWNRWHGKKTPQLMIEETETKPPGMERCPGQNPWNMV